MLWSVYHSSLVFGNDMIVIRTITDISDIHVQYHVLRRDTRDLQAASLATCSYLYSAITSSTTPQVLYVVRQ